MALKIKAIKSHFVLLRLFQDALKAYQLRYKDYISGFKLVLIGKINNSLRTRKYVVSAGNINQYTFAAIIDYSQAESFSLSGIFTVRL
jgi:hypothetical protein